MIGTPYRAAMALIARAVTKVNDKWETCQATAATYIRWFTYMAWYYAVLAAIFVSFHVTHAAIVFGRYHIPKA